MKSRRRCCRRPLILGINRLITVLVLELMGDIRWQRHLSQLIKNLLKDSLIFKADQTIALVHNLLYLGMQKSPAKGKTHSRSCLFARLNQCLPDIICLSLKQKYLYLSTGSFPLSDQTCRNYLCIIDHQTVSLMKIINNVMKDPVRAFSCFFI